MKTLIECCVISTYFPEVDSCAGYIYELMRFGGVLMWVYADKKLSLSDRGDNKVDYFRGTKEEIEAICKERALPVVDRSTDLAFPYWEGDLDN